MASSENNFLRAKFRAEAEAHGYKVRRIRGEVLDLDSLTAIYPMSALEAFVRWIFEDSPPKRRVVTTRLLIEKWADFTRVYSV